MPTYRIDLAYDGSGFRGYAANAGVRTVQGVLEGALFRHFEPVPTYVAGRTDAGVHATKQVVSFTVDRTLDTAAIKKSVNRQLGGEVVVNALVAVPEGFHARFSAAGRRYRYTLLNRADLDPFLRHWVWHVPFDLDRNAMEAAAKHVVGTHDFASFCRKADGRSTVRMVRESAWHARQPDLVDYEIEASSFCHQMVRSLVAVMVDVGRGRIDGGDVPTIIEACDRHAGRGVAPPHGLTLVDVTY